jgi:hypothetical protein
MEFIVLLFVGFLFALYKSGLFSDDEWENSPPTAPPPPEHIIRRLQAAISELERKRSDRANSLQRLTSAQRAKLQEPPALTCDLIGESFALDMRIRDATENGGVFLGCEDPDWASFGVKIDTEYVLSLNKGQSVRVEGRILDADYDTSGNLTIWCSVGGVKFDGRDVEAVGSMIMHWGPERPRSPASGRCSPTSNR